MSALFKPRRKITATEDWARILTRRSSPVQLRLQAALFVSYQGDTGARETDTFQRDAKTWALFEHAVLPELENFTFFDKSRELYVTPSAVLAGGMFHVWTETDLGVDSGGRPTTIRVIAELATYLCASYETTRSDQREPPRNWLGLRSKR